MSSTLLGADELKDDALVSRFLDEVVNKCETACSSSATGDESLAPLYSAINLDDDVGTASLGATTHFEEVSSFGSGIDFQQEQIPLGQPLEDINPMYDLSIPEQFLVHLENLHQNEDVDNEFFHQLCEYDEQPEPNSPRDIDMWDVVQLQMGSNDLSHGWNGKVLEELVHNFTEHVSLKHEDPGTQTQAYRRRGLDLAKTHERELMDKRWQSSTYFNLSAYKNKLDECAQRTSDVKVGGQLLQQRKKKYMDFLLELSIHLESMLQESKTNLQSAEGAVIDEVPVLKRCLDPKAICSLFDEKANNAINSFCAEVASIAHADSDAGVVPQAEGKLGAPRAPPARPTDVTAVQTAVQHRTGLVEPQSNELPQLGVRKARRARGKDISPEARNVLEAFVEQHLLNPYPTAQERNDLCARTNLEPITVKNWFINYRARWWRPMVEDCMNGKDGGEWQMPSSDRTSRVRTRREN